jgi:hypothetical protein
MKEPKFDRPAIVPNYYESQRSGVLPRELKSGNLPGTTSIKLGEDITIDGRNRKIEIGDDVTLDGPNSKIEAGAGIVVDGANNKISVDGQNSGRLDVDDVNGNQIMRLGDKGYSTSIWELYYLDTIEQAIIGGELDGVTYTTYWLDIRVYHSFSSFVSGAIPYYMIWGKEMLGGSMPGLYQYANNLASLDINGGTYNGGSGDHQSVLINDGSNPLEEFIQCQWTVTRTAGTVVIPDQTVKFDLAIMYARTIQGTTPIPGQGGGGGILYKLYEIYI